MITIENASSWLTGNSDFSGWVTIGYIGDHGEQCEVTIPGPVFRGLAKAALLRDFEAMLESAADNWMSK